MNFFTASPVDKLFSLLSLSHFTEFYYHEGAVMSKERLFILQDSQDSNDSPKVHAFISQDTHHKSVINVSFMIEKVDGLQFNDFHHDKIAKADNLWQETCLECFISLDNERYLEVNATPDGRHAIYEFDGYRTPSPPTPSDKISLSWRADDNDNTLVYERHFSLDMSAVANVLDLTQSKTLISPTVILMINNKPHYFATHHGDEPDFHDKRHWQVW